MKYWTEGRTRGRNVILQVCLIDCIEILKVQYHTNHFSTTKNSIKYIVLPSSTLQCDSMSHSGEVIKINQSVGPMTTITT